MTIKFGKWGDKRTASQNFDKKNIFIEKYGKKINLYEQTQENNVDTDIYKTLEKYGSLERMQVNKVEISEELAKIRNLRDAFDIQIKVGKMFDNLPHDVRAEFKNDPRFFYDNAEKWLNNKIETAKKEKETKKEQVTDEQKQ